MQCIRDRSRLGFAGFIFLSFPEAHDAAKMQTIQPHLNDCSSVTGIAISAPRCHLSSRLPLSLHES